MKTEAERLLEAKADELGRGLQQIVSHFTEGAEGHVAKLRELREQSERFQAAQSERVSNLEHQLMEVNDKLQAMRAELDQVQASYPKAKAR